MTDVTKNALAGNIKTALTKMPYAIATWVTLAGFAYLILSKWF